MKKVDLQKEGFNPNTTTDKIYYLSSKKEYEILTSQIYQDILQEKIRF